MALSFGMVLFLGMALLLEMALPLEITLPFGMALPLQMERDYLNYHDQLDPKNAFQAALALEAIPPSVPTK